MKISEQIKKLFSGPLGQDTSNISVVHLPYTCMYHSNAVRELDSQTVSWQDGDICTCTVSILHDCIRVCGGEN